VASLSQGRTAAAQCGLFTHKSVPVIFEPPCIRGVKFPSIKCVQNIFALKYNQTDFNVNFALSSFYFNQNSND